MSKHCLTQRRVDNAKPRKKQYELTDRKVKGFFLRVYPQKHNAPEDATRKNWFLRITHQGESHFFNIGDAATIPIEKARTIAERHIARIRAVPNTSILFEHVAAEVFEGYSRRWKPSTLKVSQQYYRLYIESYFTGWAIDSITHSDVQTWFSTLSETPASANRALQVLSVIMRESENYGYRAEDSNPCSGIRRLRTPKREKYLTEDEITQLGEILRQYEDDFPNAVYAIYLILLTGCRRSEILSLQWRWYRDGCLYLPDSKTGPRIIYLCKDAQAVLATIRKRSRKQSKYVFPAERAHAKSGFTQDIFGVWKRIRNQMGLHTLRLHDLRHTYASHALRMGVNIRVISRLLGHSNPNSTLCYLHLVDDSMTEAVAHINKTMLNGGHHAEENNTN